MRKIIYKIIKIPLIFIFLKTPLIRILKKRFFSHRSLKSRSYFMSILDRLFQGEYLSKQKNHEYTRELLSSTVKFGEGEKWALHYYSNPAQSLENLKKRKVGSISDFENRPIFQEIISFIQSKNLEENEDTFLIQLGSSSGKDLEFFNKYFPKLKYISTDINDEILDFQKKKYKNKGFKFFKCYAEDIDKCIDALKLSDKNIILFSIGSLQYVIPFYLEQFFFKIKKIKNLNLFICDPVKLSFVDENKNYSDYRGNSSYTHIYEKYASEFVVLKKKVIRPFENSNTPNRDVGTYYLHIVN